LLGGDAGLAVDLLDGHVEVLADQHALAAQVEVGHAEDGHVALPCKACDGRGAAGATRQLLSARAVPGGKSVRGATDTHRGGASPAACREVVVIQARMDGAIGCARTMQAG
jgi:hypothetical protein